MFICLLLLTEFFEGLGVFLLMLNKEFRRGLSGSNAGMLRIEWERKVANVATTDTVVE